ncbi:MAG: glycine betaine/L-proline ABC transporter ATP-binding protein, partial [Hyphomicrobiaceae bacterium]
HDFEEATKLADRIGIMKDGRMVQLSTPEEMVLNPADDYVAEFARKAPRDRIVTVGAIMTPEAANGRTSENSVAARSLIGQVAEQVLNADGPIDVVDENMAVIGTVTRQRMSKALFGQEGVV